MMRSSQKLIISFVYVGAVALLMACTQETQDRSQFGVFDQTSAEAHEIQKSNVDVIPGMSDEEIAAINFQVEASQDFFQAVASEWTQHQLALQPLIKTIPIDALVFSLASKFNVNDGEYWTPTRSCEAIVPATSARANCKNSATPSYCQTVSTGLDEMYCRLGGEDRSVMSSVMREWTSGDLVLLFEFSRKICSHPDTPVRLGLGASVSRSMFLSETIPKFLTVTKESADYETEKNFIETAFINKTYPCTSDPVVCPEILKGENLGLDTKFATVFQQTCSYLLVHPRQISY